MKRHVQCAEQPMGGKTHWNMGDSYLIVSAHETSFTLGGATGLIRQHHQIYERKQLKRHVQCGADPSMNPSVRNPPSNSGYFSRFPRAFCVEKYSIWCCGNLSCSEYGHLIVSHDLMLHFGSRENKRADCVFEYHIFRLW